MDITTAIAALTTATSTDGWPIDWPERLRTAATTTRADWSLSRRDVAVSRIENATPGELELVKWVRAYARHGSPIDPVRVRISRDKKDLHSFMVHVEAEAPPSTQDRALELALRVCTDEQLRTGIIHTLTIALRPLAEAIIRPVVHDSIRDLLADPPADNMQECNSIHPQATPSHTTPRSTH